jgi:transmembrane protein
MPHGAGESAGFGEINMTPALVSGLLGSRAFQIFARIVLTTPFWAAGIQHGLAWNDWVGTMAHFNLNPPVLFAILTLATCLGGSALVIAGDKLTWLGAGALGVFTALTIPLAHAFWSMQGPAAMTEFYTVLEHVSIIGGLMIMSVLANSSAEAAEA